MNPETDSFFTHPLSRRDFLLKAAAVVTTSFVPPWANAADGFWDYPRTLWLRREVAPGRWEEARAVYWQDGGQVWDGYYQICQVLRDVNARQAVQMNMVLLDILRGIQGWFEAYGYQLPIVINSGFRTVQTNSSIEGAAKDSMHLRGCAADIKIPGIPVDYLAKLGLYLNNAGGVGYYPRKDMIHVDKGRLRVWRG